MDTKEVAILVGIAALATTFAVAVADQVVRIIKSADLEADHADK